MGRRVLGVVIRAYGYLALFMFFTGMFGAMWLLSTGQTLN